MTNFDDDAVDIIKLLCTESTAVMEDIPYIAQELFEKHRKQLEEQIKFHIGEILRQGCVSYRTKLSRM